MGKSKWLGKICLPLVVASLDVYVLSDNRPSKTAFAARLCSFAFFLAEFRTKKRLPAPGVWAQSTVHRGCSQTDLGPNNALNKSFELST